MTIEELLKRAQEIEAAIINMTSQLSVLHGHKNETAYWIQQLQAKQDETQVESAEDPVVE
jgi:hypothetical protein